MSFVVNRNTAHLESPRPSPELRRKLFGHVTPKRPPPLVPFDAGFIDQRLVGPQLMVHALAHDIIVELFFEWADADLTQHILSIDRMHEASFGEYGQPRTHAWGNAFDINTQWNPPGGDAALEGAPGHIPPLMFTIARRRGFWCGVDWRRPEVKHFELTVLT